MRPVIVRVIVRVGLAVLLGGPSLVESLQLAVVPFVQPPGPVRRHPHPVHLVHHDPQRADSALERGGEGEVDLVVRRPGEVVFVEVKTRRSSAFGSPAEAVGPRKQRQIIRAAKWYLNDNPGKTLQPRFDVVSVLINGSEMAIEHIPGAFEA